MNTVATLEARIQDLGRVLSAESGALALLGLGSVGIETSRLDEWSDVDFFAIVQKGSKQRFLDDTTWIDKAHPVVYRFRNTVDGFKLLFADGTCIFVRVAKS